jgi:hypothetical protein
VVQTHSLLVLFTITPELESSSILKIKILKKSLAKWKELESLAKHGTGEGQYRFYGRTGDPSVSILKRMNSQIKRSDL